MPSANRPPLTDGQRRAAFATVAVVLVGVLALLSSPGGGAHPAAHAARAARPVTTHPSALADAAPRIVGSSSTTPAPATSTTATTNPAQTIAAAGAPPALPGVAVRHRRAVMPAVLLAQARQFLRVYLVYEVQPLDAVMRRALRRSATGALTASLIAHPVRLGARDRPAVGTVRSLEVGADPDSTTATVDATIEHAGWVSGMVLDFAHGGGRWLVSRLS